MTTYPHHPAPIDVVTMTTYPHHPAPIDVATMTTYPHHPAPIDVATMTTYPHHPAPIDVATMTTYPHHLPLGKHQAANCIWYGNKCILCSTYSTCREVNSHSPCWPGYNT